MSMGPKKVCALSVDLDPLTAYYTIHGLGAPPPQVEHTIMRKALPRFEELFALAGVPATFFVVGQEVERHDEAQQLLGKLVKAGHELANHTYSHPYDLCRLPEDQIAEEIERAHRVLADVAGEAHAPVGFRTPGYFVNGPVMRALVAQGYRYDSSMFPSPAYYLAKAVVMGLLALRGRRSGAVLANPRGLFGPADPYRPDLESPWRRGDAPLVELPVAVLPFARLPAIGTMLAVSPEGLRRRVISAMRHRPLFNLELHGIDLVDAVVDCIPTELAGRQPDLRVPFVKKRDILVRSIEELKEDFEFVTLRQAAARFQ